MAGERPVRGVMFFVADQAGAARWYRDVVFRRGVIQHDQGYRWIDLAGVEVGFHPADSERNPVGGGVVAYFATDGLDAACAAAVRNGAGLHRGPLDIGERRAICQLVDPFGNVFGLDGPR